MRHEQSTCFTEWVNICMDMLKKYLTFVFLISAGDCYMLASTVSSKILQAIAQREGFNFEVSYYKCESTDRDNILAAGLETMLVNVDKLNMR